MTGMIKMNLRALYSLKVLLAFVCFDCTLYASYRPSELTDAQKIDAYGINNSHEFQRLIDKVKLSKEVKLSNDTGQDAHIRAVLAKKDNEIMTFHVQLKAHTSFSVEPPQDWYLQKVDVTTSQRLSLKPTTHNLSLHRRKKGGRKIVLNEKPAIAFPLPLGDFTFFPRFLLREFKESDKEYHDHTRPVPSNLTERFKKEYDDNLAYLIYAACPGEKVSHIDFFKHRQEMYERNRLEKLFTHLTDAPDKVSLKIPQRIHKVWLTNPDDPRELPENYIAWAESTVKSCPPGEGWKTYLWVQDGDLLPDTMKKIKEMGVKVGLVGKLTATVEESQVLINAIKAKKFGVASDFARAMIIREKGGIYTDTDYVLSQSPIVLCKTYNFFAGLEPMSSFVGNACFGASKNHPIITKYIELMVRNYSERLVPGYIKKIPDNDGFKTILLTGPSPFGFAIFHAANKDGNVDIIFPPKMLYPTPVNDYPQKVVVKDGDPLPEESLGKHFWETAWNRPTFGSNG